MPGSGGVGDGAPERPRCQCHDEPMHRAGAGRWECAVKGRERARRWKQANPAKRREQRKRWKERQKAEHPEKRAYARGRSKLRSRIARKRQQIAALEASLAEEDTRRTGEGEDRQGDAHPHPPEAFAGGG